MNDKIELEVVATFNGLYLTPVAAMEPGTNLCRITDAQRLLSAAPAQQPAPVAVPDDLRRDEAYRNGLMAGFGFGLKGDEAGYATALAGYSREIHEARAMLAAAPAAPVAVGLEPVAWEVDVKGYAKLLYKTQDAAEDSVRHYVEERGCEVSVMPLYAAPPAAEQPGERVMCHACFAENVRPDHFDGAGKCKVIQSAAEQPDTVRVSREDAEILASFFEAGGSIRLVDAGYRAAAKLRALLAGGEA
ncbi:MAG TPA: hypothetical protein VIZ86_16430 [Pseudomonas sp.]